MQEYWNMEYWNQIFFPFLRERALSSAAGKQLFLPLHHFRKFQFFLCRSRKRIELNPFFLFSKENNSFHDSVLDKVLDRLDFWFPSCDEVHQWEGLFSDDVQIKIIVSPLVRIETWTFIERFTILLLGKQRSDNTSWRYHYVTAIWWVLLSWDDFAFTFVLMIMNYLIFVMIQGDPGYALENISFLCWRGEAERRKGRNERRHSRIEWSLYYISILQDWNRTIFFLKNKHTSGKGIFIRFRLRNITYVKFKIHHARKVWIQLTGHSLKYDPTVLVHIV